MDFAELYHSKGEISLGLVQNAFSDGVYISSRGGDGCKACTSLRTSLGIRSSWTTIHARQLDGSPESTADCSNFQGPGFPSFQNIALQSTLAAIWTEEKRLVTARHDVRAVGVTVVGELAPGQEPFEQEGHQIVTMMDPHAVCHPCVEKKEAAANLGRLNHTPVSRGLKVPGANVPKRARRVKHVQGGLLGDESAPHCIFEARCVLGIKMAMVICTGTSIAISFNAETPAPRVRTGSPRTRCPPPVRTPYLGPRNSAKRRPRTPTSFTLHPRYFFPAALHKHQYHPLPLQSRPLSPRRRGVWDEPRRTQAACRQRRNGGRVIDGWRSALDAQPHSPSTGPVYRPLPLILAHALTVGAMPGQPVDNAENEEDGKSERAARVSQYLRWWMRNCSVSPPTTTSSRPRSYRRREPCDEPHRSRVGTTENVESAPPMRALSCSHGAQHQDVLCVPKDECVKEMERMSDEVALKSNKLCGDLPSSTLFVRTTEKRCKSELPPTRNGKREKAPLAAASAECRLKTLTLMLAAMAMVTLRWMQQLRGGAGRGDGRVHTDADADGDEDPAADGGSSGVDVLEQRLLQEAGTARAIGVFESAVCGDRAGLGVCAGSESQEGAEMEEERAKAFDDRNARMVVLARSTRSGSGCGGGCGVRGGSGPREIEEMGKEMG
ncbi:hypothetical protein DFH06DRAFT_1304063 [Mycena polygramma]|nr:hypothetical protein DFH06DRAFT_1304063 [Mycena polygramma]